MSEADKARTTFSAVKLNPETAQHYLVHLFRETLAASQSRIVVVSSGAIRNLRGQDPSKMPMLPLVDESCAHAVA